MSEKNIIGIIGFAGSGKGTVGDFLGKHGYRKIAFADNLKDACASIFSWDRKMLEGVTKESRIWREQPDPWWSEQLGKEITPRWVLQVMGTEGGRELFGYNLWVASAMKKVYNSRYDNWVFTDCRFVNEIEAIEKAGGRIFAVMRGELPEYYQMAAYDRDKMSIRSDVHPSEWDWCTYHSTMPEERIIRNDGTLLDLQKEIYNKVIKS